MYTLYLLCLVFIIILVPVFIPQSPNQKKLLHDDDENT